MTSILNTPEEAYSTCHLDDIDYRFRQFSIKEIHHHDWC